jgi:hypothetical protein
MARGRVDAGAALAVMGNHELNAIAWHTPDARRPGEFLRSHHSEEWGEKNRKQHAAFLVEVEDQPARHAEIIDWFLTLPLWLDLPEDLCVGRAGDRRGKGQRRAQPLQGRRVPDQGH